MKFSTFALLPASIGVATAGVIAREPEPASNLTARGNEGCELAFWNDFSKPLSGDDACYAFRSLEWLVYELMEPTEDITSEAGTKVFVDPEEQGGPVVLVLRGIMIWTAFLEDLQRKLQATNVWSMEAQLQVTQCYLAYAYQVAGFLFAFEQQACDFGRSSPVRCLIYDKIEALYIAYETVAELVYGGNNGVPKDVQELITGDFPEFGLEDYDTRYGRPNNGYCLKDWIAQNDIAIEYGYGLFAQNQKAYTCSDFQDCDGPQCREGRLEGGRGRGWGGRG